MDKTVKTRTQKLLRTTGDIYTALNLTLPANVEEIERAMNMAQYVFTRRAEKEISDADAKAKLNELITHVQSFLELTTAENTQRIKENKQPY